MNNLPRLRSAAPAKSLSPASEPLASNDEDAYLDAYCIREFGEFIESISATPEELAAIVSMPELSIAEIKELVRDGRLGYPQTDLFAPGAASQAVVVKIRPPGVRSNRS